MNIQTRSSKKKYINNKNQEEEPEDNFSDLLLHVENNNVYFYSEITTETIFKLRISLQKLIDKHNMFSVLNDCDPIPIKLYINSPGGEVKDALTIVDLINNSSVPIHTIIEGEAASAATLISVVGHKRFINQNANMLIHQISSGFWGKYMEIEDEIKNIKLYMEKLKKIYKENTELEITKLDKMLKKDILWNSKICLKYGLVDEII